MYVEASQLELGREKIFNMVTDKHGLRVVRIIKCVNNVQKPGQSPATQIAYTE